MYFLRSFAIVLILCGGLTAAETKPSLTLEQLEAIAIQPAKHYEETNSRVVPEMLPLFKAETIVYTGKEKYKETELGFRLHVPENMEPGKKYPLILWLHGVGEAGTDNQDQLVHLHHIITYLTGPNKRDFFLLVPQTPKDHTCWDARMTYIAGPVETIEEGIVHPGLAPSLLGRLFGSSSAPITVYQARIVPSLPIAQQEPFEDSPLGFSFAMLDQVTEDYPVDTDRITVAGLSSGGDGTWRALERRPEQFAAAVPLVSWNALKDDAIAEHPVLKKIPIWAIYSSDDRGIGEAREDFARVEAAGCNVKKSEFGLCGHNAWTPAMLQADIFSWLLSRAKKDGEYVAVVDANVDPDDLKGVVEVAERISGKAPQLAPEAPLVVPDPEAWQELEQRRAERAEAAKVPEPPVALHLGSDKAHPAMILPVPENDSVWIALARRKAALEDRLERLKGVLKRADDPQIRSLEENLRLTDEKMNEYRTRFLVDRGVREVQDAQDALNVELALRYMKARDTESFHRIYAKLSFQRKKMLLEQLLKTEFPPSRLPPITLQEIEALIDALQSGPTEPGPVVPDVGGTAPGSEEEVRVGTLPGSKIVEECDREWAMTSESLYGMFPADWGKEGQRIPDFVVKSTAAELALILRDDPAKLEQVCKSILSLEHRPMSSPWLETSGGRLRSDIRYTLSAKGAVLVALLKKSDSAQAKRTLEKIETLLAASAPDAM